MLGWASESLAAFRQWQGGCCAAGAMSENCGDWQWMWRRGLGVLVECSSVNLELEGRRVIVLVPGLAARQPWWFEKGRILVRR